MKFIQNTIENYFIPPITLESIEAFSSIFPPAVGIDNFYLDSLNPPMFASFTLNLKDEFLAYIMEKQQWLKVCRKKNSNLEKGKERNFIAGIVRVDGKGVVPTLEGFDDILSFENLLGNRYEMQGPYVTEWNLFFLLEIEFANEFVNEKIKIRREVKNENGQPTTYLTLEKCS